MAVFTRTRRNVWSGPSTLAMVYLFVGVVVAATRDYFVNVNTGQEIVSAILPSFCGRCSWWASASMCTSARWPG